MSGGPDGGEVGASAPPPGPQRPAPAHEAEHDTYRGRLSAAARTRGVPLATIVTALVAGFAILDLNALVILLLWVLRSIILYTVVGGFVAFLLAPAVRLVQRAGVSRGLAVGMVFVLAVIAFVPLLAGPLS